MFSSCHSAPRFTVNIQLMVMMVMMKEACLIPEGYRVKPVPGRCGEEPPLGTQAGDTDIRASPQKAKLK